MLGRYLCLLLLRETWEGCVVHSAAGYKILSNTMRCRSSQRIDHIIGLILLTLSTFSCEKPEVRFPVLYLLLLSTLYFQHKIYFTETIVQAPRRVFFYEFALPLFSSAPTERSSIHISTHFYSRVLFFSSQIQCGDQSVWWLSNF